MHISPNCQQARDRPAREHACTGCDCTCHHVAPPVNFRDLVEAARGDSRSALDEQEKQA